MEKEKEVFKCYCQDTELSVPHYHEKETCEHKNTEQRTDERGGEGYFCVSCEEKIAG